MPIIKVFTWTSDGGAAIEGNSKHLHLICTNDGSYGDTRSAHNIL